ncbi:MAG: GNAT family N-acetyltransferase [Treponema sp.]|nr:GNAT family N-acetyltransferase [Treponema sp.]
MSEKINHTKLKEMEKDLGIIFSDNGEFAEMSLDLQNYFEQTKPILDVEYRFYDGDINELKEKVFIVDRKWPQYFNSGDLIFCGYYKGQLASFCTVDEDLDCIISSKGIKTGSIGCVGTFSEFRKKGIGLRMVDLATVYLKEKGCDKSYISYTHIEKWYGKLGYKTFARFSLRK